MPLGPILGVCSAIYLVVLVIDLVFFRARWTRLLLETTILLGLITLALLVHSAVTGRVAFGETAPPLSTLGIMLAATILGMVARYVFDLKEPEFDWFNFVKPLVISPLVLLPLISSLSAATVLSGMQMVSFALLAFQNGFFWQAVLKRAKPAIPAAATRRKHAGAS